MSTNTWIVYKHTSPTGKSYIGITHQKAPYRWGKNGNGYKQNPLLWRAIQKYGWGNFTHDILESELTEQEAFEKERYYIKKYDSYVPNGYNLSLGGESGSFGYHHTDSAKRAISEASKRKGFKGHKHTTEAKERNRLAHLGTKNPHSDTWKEKVSKSNKGKKRTEETRQKMREAKLGTHWSSERRAEYSKKQKDRGFRPSDECIKASNLARRVGVDMYINDIHVKHFNSMQSCANELGITVAYVSLICNGKLHSKKYDLRRSK